MRVFDLQCDYMQNPMGYDVDRPALSWRAEAKGINKSQSAYQYQIATDCAFNGIIKDTGKVPSDQSVCLRTDIALAPMTRYFWRVRIWDEQDNGSDWSDAAYFETARYDSPWKAEWIGGEKEFPQLRKGFALNKPLKSARIYACGVGLYQLFVNGERVSDELAPGVVAYDAWLPYQTYDVTDILKQGKNAVGAQLGNGYYKGRVSWNGIPERRNIYGDKLGLIAELVLNYEDGTTETIITDDSWRASVSPFIRTEIYDGEVYDARMAIPDWADAEYDGGSWDSAIIQDIDKKKLQAKLGTAVKVMEEIKPIEIITTPAGETVIDFGQNFGGWVRFFADVPAGTELKLQFGEALDKHGNFYRDNMRSALAEYIAISDGEPRWYRPYFTFFGFRYAMLTGFPKAPALKDFIGEVIYSSMPDTGFFECSDDRVNRLFQNARWGQRSNFIDIPTDCPQRDERMGWTGDAQVFAATACMNTMSDAFYRKYLRDLWIEQQDLGFVPVVVPYILRGANQWNNTTTGWGDAATIIPWVLYTYYGDTAILETQFDSMTAWVDYMTAQDTLGVDRYYGFHLGDWLAQDTKDKDNLFGLTPTELIATAYYAYSADIVSKAAKVLGKTAETKKYADLAKRVRKAFRDEFVSPNGRVASETQTAQLITLYMDMVEPDQRETVAGHLAHRMKFDKYKLTTGFLGTPYLCPMLSANGLNEYAYELLLQTAFPSWLFMVERGATTMWERWNSINENGDFGPVSMNSLNHYAYGSIAEWMYRYVGGINPVECAPGYKKALLRPMPNDKLSHANTRLDTVHGTIKSNWAINDGELTVEFEIPFNVKAEIELPCAAGASILENGKPISETQFERGSGIWKYTYKPDESISKRVPSGRMFG